MSKEIAVPYLRVSTDKQDEQYQLQYIEKFIQEHGWEQGETYKDSGISAYKEKAIRHDFERMLKDAKTQQFKHIVVYDLDRFSRKKAEEVIDLVKKLRLMYGVEVNAVFGDEWRDLVNVINKLPDMGFVGKAIADFIETFIVGIKAHESHTYSKKLSQNVKASKKFQLAKKENRVGRTKKDFTDKENFFIEEMIRLKFSWRKIADTVNKSRIEENKERSQPKQLPIVSYSTIRRVFQKGGVKNDV